MNGNIEVTNTGIIMGIPKGNNTCYNRKQDGRVILSDMAYKIE
jgi:hypothetical protein